VNYVDSPRLSPPPSITVMTAVRGVLEELCHKVRHSSSASDGFRSSKSLRARCEIN
jgi:hypothetical protein